MLAARHRSFFDRVGFTLVEIMVVVVIIGLLAAIALPAMSRVQRNAQNARVISDIRTFAQGFETFALKNGHWPPDGTPRVLPTGMSGEIKDTAWAADPAVGGQWDWDLQQFGITAGISIFEPKIRSWKAGLGASGGGLRGVLAVIWNNIFQLRRSCADPLVEAEVAVA